MTIFDVVRNAVLAGFGAQEKVLEFIDDLVKKGELSESQGAKLFKEWSDKADKGASEVGKSLSELVDKTFQSMHIPTRDEVDALKQQMQSLSSRIKKLEDTLGEGKPV